MWINKATRNTSEIFVIYLVPWPVQDRSWGRFSFTELRGGQKAAADTGEAVRRWGASSISEMLGAGMEVPTANTSVSRRWDDYQFRLRHLVGFARSTRCIVDCRNSFEFLREFEIIWRTLVTSGSINIWAGQVWPKQAHKHCNSL